MKTNRIEQAETVREGDINFVLTRFLDPETKQLLRMTVGTGDRTRRVAVPIYRTVNRVNGKLYEQPTLKFTPAPGIKSVKRRFSSWDRAIEEAKLVVAKLARGQAEMLDLTPAERAAYVQARRLLKPLGKDLNLAVADYVDAVKLLPTDATLKEAVADFARRQASVRESKLVPDLVTEYLNGKEAVGRSKRHLDDLRARLGAFSQAFVIPVGSLTDGLIQQFLERPTWTGRTRLNYLRHIVGLVRFAVRRKYASRDLLDELDSIERPEPKPTDTLIFTPDELIEMLCSIRPALVPWLAVAAFCGLRTAEILRLDWREVNLQRRFVEVKALNAKTASRRLIPICDAAVAWLMPHWREEGPVAPYSEENKFHAALLHDVNAARKAAGKAEPFRWKRNGLRHSFCSFRLAVTSDAAKTALEAGNSPTMIFKHYRELTTPEEAQRWFSVMPPASDKIIPLTAGAIPA